MPSDHERSVSDVLQDIFGNLQEIVRSEVHLAKAEVKTTVGEAAQAGKPIVLGAALAFYAGGLLLLALVHGLSLILQPWVAALSVGLLLSVIAAVLINMGRAQLRIVSPHSRKTIETEGVSNG
jgi:hypothetical protein